VPGVNHVGTHGRWAFAELTEMYTIESDFKAKVGAELAALLESLATAPLS
jgi:type III restriction enzyme